MDKNQTMDVNHQSDLDESHQQHNGSLLSQANLIIGAWQQSAEDVLKNYQDSLGKVHTEKGSLADEFEFLSYQSIQKNLKLPEELCIVDESARITVAINFQNKPRNVLRLYLCVIGEVQTPKWIYAELQYQFGWQIAFMQEDLNCDVPTANLRFKAWFSQVMDAMFKGWLNQ